MTKKKFDVAIMNPPYDGSLHLKIIKKVIPIADEVVNISPIRWLQDPLAKYKKNSDYNKFEESISKHIKSIQEIDTKDSIELFNAGILSDTAIIKIDGKNEYIVYKSNENKIIEKVIKTGEHLNDVLSSGIDGWRWTMSDLQPFTAQGGKKYSYGWYRRFAIYNNMRSTIYYNGKKDGKDWTSFNSGIKKEEGSIMSHSIKFNSEQDALNFENSLKTDFYHYCVFSLKTDQHTPWSGLPWMGNVKNPRTRKIGYESEWTNEDFCKYFNITGFISDTEAEPGSEWEEILNAIKKFDKTVS